jgi:phage antirepressor YoqD-like protein
MQVATQIKSAAHKLIDDLSDDEVSWEKIIYEMDLRASIERGLLDVKSENVVSMDDMLEEFGFKE